MSDNLYAPPTAEVADVPGATTQVYAGFWIRVAATLVDTLLIVAVTYPFLLIIYGSAYFDDERTGFIAGPADFAISWLAPAVATVLFWIVRQAQPGKMLVKARVVDAKSGGAPTAGQSIGRYFAYFVSALPLCAGFFWIAFDARKQGWHDKLAGTLVVRSSSTSTVEDAGVSFDDPSGARRR